MIKLNKNEKALLYSLNYNAVKFIVIGGMAVEFYTNYRIRNDIDIFISTEKSNIENFLKSINKIIGIIPKLTLSALSRPNIHISFKEVGYNFDILTSINNVNFTFNDAYKTKNTIIIDGINIPFINKEKLIETKAHIKNNKDIVDVKELKNV